MATDVKLDEGDGTFVVLEGRVVKAVGSDFVLDSPERHKSGGPNRRAMVHDQSDGLTINYDGDYPGGVTIWGITEIIPKKQVGSFRAPTLMVRGAISYEVHEPGIAPGGINTTVKTTVYLEEELAKLYDKIEKLSARLATLERK